MASKKELKPLEILAIEICDSPAKRQLGDELFTRMCNAKIIRHEFLDDSADDLDEATSNYKIIRLVL